MIDLYQRGMSIYKQNNAITERTLKYFSGEISHVLCGPCHLGNLHSVMGWDVDSVVPKGMQWEDYVASVIWNSHSEDDNFPPSNPSYYPGAMRDIFGEDTTEIVWKAPDEVLLKSYLDSGKAVGVCWHKTEKYYHYIVIRGYTNTGWLTIDSAPDLSQTGKMMYEIPMDTCKSFSERFMVVVKECPNGK